MKMKEKISLFAGSVLGVITSYLASLSTLVKVLILFMIIDYILGIVVAFIEKKIMSGKMFKGGLKKGVSLTIVVMSFYLGAIIDFPLLQDIVIMYYVSMETLSIFEHALKLDVPLPNFLKELAERLAEQTDQGKVGNK